MKESLTLAFRIMEPMMFRGPGEFDPFVRGTYSRGDTFMMPSPSTIAGTLATYCISKLNRPIPQGCDWIERYCAVLGPDVKMRGPLITIGGKLMAEDRTLNTFLGLDQIKEKCEALYKRLTFEPKSIRELEDYLRMEPFKPEVPSTGKIDRTGVMLMQRHPDEKKSGKTTKEGFLYGAEYVDYSQIIGEGLQAEILAEVRGSIVEELAPTHGAPVKFGGESRIALLSFQRESRLTDEAEKLWLGRGSHEGILALYIISPALFKGGRPIREEVEEWVSMLGYRFCGISGESEALGAGFDLFSNRRKPIYSSLKPGSIIFLEGSFDLMDIHWGKGLGEASQIGYGSFLAVPL